MGRARPVQEDICLPPVPASAQESWLVTRFSPWTLVPGEAEYGLEATAPPPQGTGRGGLPGPVAKCYPDPGCPHPSPLFICCPFFGGVTPRVLRPPK